MRKAILVCVTAVGILGSAASYSVLAQSDDGQAEPHNRWEEIRGALLDARLAGLRAGLRLSSDQESAWSGFEIAVRRIAKDRAVRRHAAHEHWQDEHEHFSPIDRLRMRSDRLARRSTDLKALADAAAPLYASLDDQQKRTFGPLFRQFGHQGDGAHHHHRHERE